MANKLVIAEKPSVGMTYAGVLGAKIRKPGYIEGNGYIITWCFGHLAAQANADAYSPKFKVWRREDLPVLPPEWKYKIPDDKFKQFQRLKELMHREDVTEVINACDAGREGELIFRNTYLLAKCEKPVRRLWLSSMEDDAIRDGFANLKDGTDYALLYAAADCRAKADWLVGINASRLFSILYHRTLNVGRVVSPTLSLIAQREAEIDAFIPQPYYTVQLQMAGFTASSEHFPTRERAEAAAEAFRMHPVIVDTIENKEKMKNPPKLYDLTALQRDANRLLGYTAQQTLDYLQSLYEKKFCTYPRTDSRFLTDDMENKVPGIAAVSAKLLGIETPVHIHAMQVCNSKCVTDHYAILPTRNAGSDTLSLPSGEHELLLLIARQVLCATSEPYRFIDTTATFTCGGFTFTAHGNQIVNAGYRQFLSDLDEDRISLPSLTEGQEMCVTGHQVFEGMTQPPKHFTEATLLAAMENAGRDEMPEDAEHKGLGTPATRSNIIEKLVSTNLVIRSKAAKHVHLLPTPAGIALITILPEELQSPLLTADWERRLIDIESGESDAHTFLTDIKVMVTKLVQSYQAVPGAEFLFPSDRPIVGTCPRCGSDVTESKKGYFCERNECRFGLWRDSKYLEPKRIDLNRNIVTTLLRDGRVSLKNIWSPKTGKHYDATLVLTDDGGKTRYHLEFPERT